MNEPAAPDQTTIDPSNAESLLLENGRLLFAQPWRFVKGCVAIDGLPPMDMMEIAFAGRSNVGKSSLINALVGMKALARTSNTPGRTQELNIFEPENGAIRIVDMPGYGYAKAPKKTVETWTRLIHAYLRGRQNLRRVYCLVDGRHGPNGNDISVMNELDTHAVSYQIILTKSDKVKAIDRAKVLEKTFEAIKKRPAAHPQIISTSSEKGDNVPELRATIYQLTTD